MREQTIDLPIERIGFGEIVDTQSAASDLVFICGSDAPTGRSDLGVGRIFTSDVEIAMQRQDEAGVVGEHQTLRRDEHALTAQALDFLGEHPGIDDHAIADDGELALDKA